MYTLFHLTHIFVHACIQYHRLVLTNTSMQDLCGLIDSVWRYSVISVTPDDVRNVYRVKIVRLRLTKHYMVIPQMTTPTYVGFDRKFYPQNLM